MADRYALTLEQAAVESSPGEAIGTLFTATAAPKSRAEIYYMAFSAGGTMADQLQRVQVQRITAIGTEGAGVTPAILSLPALAGEFDGAENHSVEPTYTSATELWEADVHIRALAQVQLQPDGHIHLPATQNAGIGVRSFSGSYTGDAHAVIHYME